MPRHEPKRVSGFTLVEVMIALGIMGIVGTGVTVYFVQLNDAHYRMEAIGTRDALNLRIRRTINLATIQYSAGPGSFGDSGNARLAQCVLGNGSCQDTNTNVPVPFVLSYPQGQSPVIVAGTQSHTSYYCHSGAIYSAANPCAYEWKAQTFFVAGCPGNQASCSKALYVRVSYTLQNVYLKGQPLLKPPGGANSNSGTYATIQIPQAAGVGSSPCQPLSAVYRIDNQGQQYCRCLPGTTQTGISGNQPTCQLLPNLSCPAGQVPTGYDTNLNPICRAASNCQTIPATSICNGYVQSATLGGCNFPNPGGKKKGSKKGPGLNISNFCSQDVYVCCTSN